MRLQLSSTVQATCGLLCLWACFDVQCGRADETDGRWSGTLEGRGNYYLERSTRVVVPEISVKLTAPNGVRVGGAYLLDVISSASIAQGGSKQDAVFTELRHAVNADVGKEFSVGETPLDLKVFGTYSTESDYESFIYGLESSVSLNERATRLTLSATRVQDTVLSNADRTFRKNLSGFTVGPSVEQVIGPVLVLTVGYQFGFLEGFLANPYRRALIGPLPYPESHPVQRLRHGATARLAWFIRATNTALHLMYTAYADSWDIAALSPEIRAYQQLGNDLLLRPRYRFYAQTRAWFERPGRYPVGWSGPVTNDPKMAAFKTHTLGVSIEYRLSILANTALAFAKDTWIDIAFDRYWSTSRFGNGFITTAGGRLAF